jgi:hypothetical protein
MGPFNPHHNMHITNVAFGPYANHLVFGTMLLSWPTCMNYIVACSAFLSIFQFRKMVQSFKSFDQSNGPNSASEKDHPNHIRHVKIDLSKMTRVLFVPMAHI